MRFGSIFLLVLIVIVSAFGCSSANNPVDPAPEAQAAETGHQVWGALSFSWDGVSQFADVIPDRQLSLHVNVTASVIPDFLTVEIVSWDAVNRILTANATIENPTLLDAYDVRGILFNMGSKKLINADDYTKLFDPFDPKVANPFRAFAKDETNRKFWNKNASPSQYIKTEQYVIYFPGATYVDVIFEASWPTNCPEPYDIVSIGKTGTLYETQGGVDVTVEVLDWQNTTAHHVTVEANPVTGGDFALTQSDATHWTGHITNTGGAAIGDYEVWVAAWDATAPYALYNKTTITVNEDPIAGEWGDPILISGASGVDEILPRIILASDAYWIIYSDGAHSVARKSTDNGLTWSSPTNIGTFAGLDTLHAVLGNDGDLYVQWQESSYKNIYVAKFDGSTWSGVAEMGYHGLTISPYSADLCVDSSGYIYSMLGDDWSTFGFRSNNAYSTAAWTSDTIESFYNGIYSINDGFVQGTAIPVMFFVHENTELDYAWYNGGWDKAPARGVADRLIEPAIAPESDGPYHCVIGRDDGSGSYALQYWNFASFPPASPTITNLATGLTVEPVFHSVSAEGYDLSVIYDADGDILYKESADGGTSFGAVEPINLGNGMYSHIRRDVNSSRIVAAYAVNEGGDYNIYIRIKNGSI